MKFQCATDINLADTISNGDAVQLILDPSVFFENKSVSVKIELYSRELISSLHRNRTNLLFEKERQLGLSSSPSQLIAFGDGFGKQQKP